MVRLGLALAVAALLLWAYCLVDAASADEAAVRGLPKPAWVFVVVCFSVVGSVAWLLFGRPVPGAAPAWSRPRGRAGRPVGPEDDPEFLRRLDGR